MNCNLCGRENRDEARFCDGCGGALDATVTKTGIDPELDDVRHAFADRYSVESLLGRGGMGNVYKARELTLDRYVALKVVPEGRSKEAQFIDRFRREARIAARLRHPRIVSVHEVGQMGPFPYFSMDYIDGNTLRAIIGRRHMLPQEDATAIVVEICRAVAHAHSKGIIHRDLKPENVMIDGEGDVFVMDFGLARAAEDPNFTQSGAIVGTPFYMSPEQITGSKLDERSDVYAIGLILYYCLTGEDLFRADGIAGVIAKHQTLRVREVVETHAMLPSNLQDVLVSMLEEDRNMRARSVREVLERLTLRRIVALGIAATGEPEAAVASAEENSQTVVSREAVAALPEPVSLEDARLAAAADRRKARLRSLLDGM